MVRGNNKLYDSNRTLKEFHNEFHKLYSSVHILRVIKSDCMISAGCSINVGNDKCVSTSKREKINDDAPYERRKRTRIILKRMVITLLRRTVFRLCSCSVSLLGPNYFEISRKHPL